MPYPNLGNRITIRKNEIMQNLNAADIAQVGGGFLVRYTFGLTQMMGGRRNKSKDEVPPPSHASLMADAPVGK
ncbi:hypothetical protein CSQ89_20445 [Chitinimonas sp. BJB300]|nr:hypothetical protein CSQ89_20445 [Chitinimonas sp. BJB300]